VAFQGSSSLRSDAGQYHPQQRARVSDQRQRDDSLATKTTSTGGTATFNGKASIQDITDPYNPISIDGNATLQVTMTDRGDPGTKDSIGITLWNKSGGLWFSSNWNGKQTVEQTLGGGNLVMR